MSTFPHFHMSTSHFHTPSYHTSTSSHFHTSTMSSQSQPSNFQDIGQEESNHNNNNTALITIVNKRGQDEEVDQEDHHAALITILNTTDSKEMIQLAEPFIVSRVCHAHSSYIAQAGVGFRLPSEPALFNSCRHNGTEAVIDMVPTSP